MESLLFVEIERINTDNGIGYSNVIVENCSPHFHTVLKEVKLLVVAA